MKKNKKEIIAVIPARGGSKGIPGKNIKKLNGKPLIFYILNTLSKINLIDRIIVSTESSKIKKVVKKFRLKKIEIFDRSKKLSGDKVPIMTVAKHVAETLENMGKPPNIVLQVSATCPYLKKSTIIRSIKILQKKNENNNCVVSLKKIEHEHPYRAKFLDKNNRFKKFLKNINVEKFISRQDLPSLYCTSGALYAKKYSLLKKFDGKDFNLGNRPYGIVVDDIEGINIDRLIDFEFAEFISKKN
tara:strand:- start:20897 stop:21628 length:732 start_codon:yes stop_codon:yes gene_type:complete